MDLTEFPSPNFGERRGGQTPSLVVLHFTAMETAEAALDRLCSRQHEVSSHYLIDRGGHVYRLVDEAHRAWHAGAGSWGGEADVNSRSIGIELDNDGCTPFAEPMVAALEELLRDIIARHAIPPEGIIGHSDMAPGRKDDPGPMFPWRRLADKGLSVWPCDTTKPTGGFEDACARFGYPVPPTVALNDLLATFRLRFRPEASGPLEATDIALAENLASRFPFDRSETTA